MLYTNIPSISGSGGGSGPAAAAGYYQLFQAPSGSDLTRRLTGSFEAENFTATDTGNATLFKLKPTGSAGTYYQVQTDAWGRVTSGSTAAPASGITGSWTSTQLLMGNANGTVSGIPVTWDGTYLVGSGGNAKLRMDNSIGAELRFANGRAAVDGNGVTLGVTSVNHLYIDGSKGSAVTASVNINDLLFMGGTFATLPGNVLVGTGSMTPGVTHGYFGIPKVAGEPTGVPVRGTTHAFLAYDYTNSKLGIYTSNNGWQYMSGSSGVTAHSALTGLTSGDDHTQYALLAGRSGGQFLTGSTASGGSLDLCSTGHATKGFIRMGGTSGLVYDQTLNWVAIGAPPGTGWGEAHVFQVKKNQTGRTYIFSENDNFNGAGAFMLAANSGGQMRIVSSGGGIGGSFLGRTLAGNLSQEISNGNFSVGTTTAHDVAMGANNLERLTIKSAGNVLVGTGSWGTTSTNGFLGFAKGPGAPTGVPSGGTTHAFLYFDYTNNTFYVYTSDNGWKGIAFDVG